MGLCIIERSIRKSTQKVLKLVVLALVLLGCFSLAQPSTDESSITKRASTGEDRLPRALSANIPEFFRPYLLQLGPGTRRIFVNQCLVSGALCERTAKPWMRWMNPARMGKREQDRFWTAYQCVALMKLDSCPVDGSWGDWSAWSQCDGVGTCDTIQDTRTRTRSCVSPRPQRFGHPCHGQNSQMKPCPRVCTREDKEMTPAMMKSWKILIGVTAKYPALRKICGNRHCMYSDLASILPDQNLTQYWSALSCYRYGSACPEDGGWSVWGKWSACSVRCGRGRTFRTHTCNSPSPAHGGATCEGRKYQRKKCVAPPCKGPPGTWAPWRRWTACSAECGGGLTTHKRRCRRGQCRGLRSQTKLCNRKPCKADGDWAEWSAWAKCSGSCDWGVRMRDRTCSAPAPEGGGATCQGPGSEVAHCFQKPCLVPKAGMEFKGKGRISYDPSGHPLRALVVSVRFMPTSPVGVILHREDQPCPERGCDLSVTLSLNAAHPVLEVTGKKTKVKVKSSKAVELEKWHSVVAVILYTSAHLTVDDDITDRATFTPHPGTFNYDQSMLIGGSTDNKAVGFKGVIAGVYVNFRPLSLTKNAAWQGYGAPMSTEGATHVPLEAVALHPSFTGHQYTWFPCPPDVTSLRAQLVLRMDVTSGLLLLMEGEVTESFLLVGVKDGRVKACASLGDAPACTDTGNVQSWEWHHIEVTVLDKVLSLVVDGGQSSTVPLPGPNTKPNSHKKASTDSDSCKRRVYIGGVPKSMHALPAKLASLKEGMKGVVHSVRLNDQEHVLKQEPLIVAGEELTGLALLKADHFTVLTSGPGDLIVLRCPHRHKTGVVAWLHDNRILHPNTHIHIEFQVPGEEPESVVKLRSEGGKKAREGVYLCLVTEPSGHRHLSHTFLVVPRSDTAVFSIGKLVITPDEEEMAVAVIAVVAVVSILLATGLLFAAAKYSGATTFKELWNKTALRLPFKLMVKKANGKVVPITNAEGGLVDDPTDGPVLKPFDSTSSRYSLRGGVVLKPSEGAMDNLELKGKSSSHIKRIDLNQKAEDEMQTSCDSKTSLIVTFDDTQLSQNVSDVIIESELATEGVTTALSEDSSESSSDTSIDDNTDVKKSLLLLGGIREEDKPSLLRWKRLSLEAMDYRQHKLEDDLKQSGATLQSITSKRTLDELSDVGLAETSAVKLPQSSVGKLHGMTSSQLMTDRLNVPSAEGLKPSVEILSQQHLAEGPDLTGINSSISSLPGSSNQHMTERSNLSMVNRSNLSVAGSSKQHLADRSNFTMMNTSEASVPRLSSQYLGERSNLSMVNRSNLGVAGSTNQHLADRSNITMVNTSEANVPRLSSQYLGERSNLSMVNRSNLGVAGSTNQHLADRSNITMVNTSEANVPRLSSQYMVNGSQPSVPRYSNQYLSERSMEGRSNLNMPEPSNHLVDGSNLMIPKHSNPSLAGSSNQHVLAARSNTSKDRVSHQYLYEQSNLSMAGSSNASVVQPSNLYLNERSSAMLTQTSNSKLPHPLDSTLMDRSNPRLAERSSPTVTQFSNQHVGDRSNFPLSESSNQGVSRLSSQHLPERSNFTMVDRSKHSVDRSSNYLPNTSNVTVVEKSHPSLAGSLSQYLSTGSKPSVGLSSSQYLQETSDPGFGQPSHSYPSESSSFTLTETSDPSMTDSSSRHVTERSDVRMFDIFDPNLSEPSSQVESSHLKLAEPAYVAEQQSNSMLIQRSPQLLAQTPNLDPNESSSLRQAEALTGEASMIDPASRHLTERSDVRMFDIFNPNLSEPSSQVKSSHLKLAEPAYVAEQQSNSMLIQSSPQLLAQSPNQAEALTGEATLVSQHPSELWPPPPPAPWQGDASNSTQITHGEQGLLPVPGQYHSQSLLQPVDDGSQQAPGPSPLPVPDISTSLVNRLKTMLDARQQSAEQSIMAAQEQQLVHSSEHVVASTEQPVNTSNRPSVEAIAFGIENQEEDSSSDSSGWETDSE